MIDEQPTAILGRMFSRYGDTPGLPIVSLVRWLEADADPVARVTAALRDRAAMIMDGCRVGPS
jgi:hypothetical protein